MRDGVDVVLKVVVSEGLLRCISDALDLIGILVRGKVEWLPSQHPEVLLLELVKEVVVTLVND